MNILIVENERPAVNKLQQLLQKIDPKIIVLDSLGTVEESVNWLQANPVPDLILMDIELSDGISFEIFESIEVDTPIIFTTAYDEYMLKAFKVNSVDYLLKPINEEGLAQAISKYKALYRQQKTDNKKIKLVYETFSKGPKRRFLIKIGLHFISILTNDIECFYIVGHYTFLRTFNGKEYDMEYSLQKLEEMVSPKYFFRVNRTCMVNIDSITSILSYSGNRMKLLLKNQHHEEVLVSREKVSAFKMWLDR